MNIFLKLDMKIMKLFFITYLFGICVYWNNIYILTLIFIDDKSSAGRTLAMSFIHIIISNRYIWSPIKRLMIWGRVVSSQFYHRTASWNSIAMLPEITSHFEIWNFIIAVSYEVVFINHEFYYRFTCLMKKFYKN